jgi:toxin ParE1/3/4
MAKPEYRLLWSDQADEDLLSIWRYGADEWSPPTADEHLYDIQNVCQMLLDTPELGRQRDELIHGVRSIPLDPHVIFYRATVRGIEILRILHQREDIHEIFH